MVHTRDISYIDWTNSTMKLKNGWTGRCDPSPMNWEGPINTRCRLVTVKTSFGETKETKEEIIPEILQKTDLAYVVFDLPAFCNEFEIFETKIYMCNGDFCPECNERTPNGMLLKGAWSYEWLKVNVTGNGKFH